MKTARHLLFSLLALFGVGLTVIAFAGDGDLLDALLQRSATRGTRVVPDRFLRAWDPVTVFYGSAKGKVGPEDNPDRFAKLRP